LTCAQAIYQTPLEGTVAPGTAFDYGGSQWHLAGAVAEVVGGDSWANLYRKYISDPCDLEVFEYGNMFFNTASWTGYPDSLMGRSNPNIEGGAISNLQDMAKLLRMHLNEGRCGDVQVISEADARRMRVDIGTALGSGEWLTGGGRGYGLGWWVPPVAEGETPMHFQDPGAFGSVSWIDIGRGYGAFVALSQYQDLLAARQGPTRIIPELIPMIDDVMDNPQ
jgi:CubicO group peptidase (beta-lactamase class C family)